MNKIVVLVALFLIVSCTLQIALGTVTNIDEAVQWLNYTYLVVRMRKNPIAYGMSYNELEVSYVVCGKLQSYCVRIVNFEGLNLCGLES